MSISNALNQPLFSSTLVASNGGLLYSTASAIAILSGTATANQVAMSGASTTPSWSTATYPATTTVNQILYSSSSDVITGLATGNSGALITSAGGIPSISSTLPNAVQDNITRLGTIANIGAPLGGTYGGTGVNNGSSTVTIGGSVTFSGAFTFTATITNTTAVTFPTSGTLATTSQVITPVNQTSGSVTMASNHSYITNNGASLVTYTLPATSAIGDILKIVGNSSGGWFIAQTSGQQIRFGSVTTTSGAGGSLASTNQGDCVELICNTANTIWSVSSVMGLLDRI